MTGSSLISVLYPSICHICGSRLAEGEQGICALCREHLPRTYFHNRRLNPMEQRVGGLYPFVKATGLFYYARSSSVAQLVQDIKYRGFPRLAVTMGRIMAEELGESGFFDGIDVIVPIPLHLFKRMRRGYNQTEKLARGISEITGIAVSTALKARRGHATQTALTHARRWDNMKDVFRLKDAESMRGKHILLVDDICTTGATLISAAKAIAREMPGVSISALTFGIAH